MALLVTREILGRKLGIDPRRAVKNYSPVHELILGDTERIPLYLVPTKDTKKATGAR